MRNNNVFTKNTVWCNQYNVTFYSMCFLISSGLLLFRLNYQKSPFLLHFQKENKFLFSFRGTQEKNHAVVTLLNPTLLTSGFYLPLGLIAFPHHLPEFKTHHHLSKKYWYMTLQRSDLPGCWQMHRHYNYNKYFVNKLTNIS